MKVTYSNLNTRTLVPITIDVKETTSPAKIDVVPKDIKSPLAPFSLTTHPLLDYQQAQFFLQQEGDYHVTVSAGSESESRDFHVTSQVFLPFWSEFGVLFVLVLALFLGTILWTRKKLRQGGRS